jgi:hypothetical protein
MDGWPVVGAYACIPFVGILVPQYLLRLLVPDIIGWAHSIPVNMKTLNINPANNSNPAALTADEDVQQKKRVKSRRLVSNEFY